ncbi:hypothetical protein SISSUDRAFT_1032656 [Sistotremastrum suecicum HHB10207 ss-3]|uniref:Uncharacterized protein n=1 Tax=Sistotremastrum suecicum HHB10207 ss-3 TaxID=1314776 RepID=A0A166ECG6_9AGAM|nr:hypothetical protein SISSUDRAFT_1032656 [Sistotremastrum suecicum HHB10207 ss-3]
MHGIARRRLIQDSIRGFLKTSPASICRKRCASTGANGSSEPGLTESQDATRPSTIRKLEDAEDGQRMDHVVLAPKLLVPEEPFYVKRFLKPQQSRSPRVRILIPEDVTEQSNPLLSPENKSFHFPFLQRYIEKRLSARYAREHGRMDLESYPYGTPMKKLISCARSREDLTTVCRVLTLWVGHGYPVDQETASTLFEKAIHSYSVDVLIPILEDYDIFQIKPDSVGVAHRIIRRVDSYHDVKVLADLFPLWGFPPSTSDILPTARLVVTSLPLSESESTPTPSLKSDSLPEPFKTHLEELRRLLVGETPILVPLSQRELRSTAEDLTRTAQKLALRDVTFPWLGEWWRLDRLGRWMEKLKKGEKSKSDVGEKGAHGIDQRQAATEQST